MLFYLSFSYFSFFSFSSSRLPSLYTAVHHLLLVIMISKIDHIDFHYDSQTLLNYHHLMELYLIELLHLVFMTNDLC